MTSLAKILTAILAAFFLLAFLYARRDRSLIDIRGPERSSFWLGIFYKSLTIWMSNQLDNSQVTKPTFDTKMKLAIASSSGCVNMVVPGVALGASV